MSYLKEIVKLVTGSPKVKENWNTRECEGYLTKEGSNFKTWKDRYFVLNNNGFLFYFRSETAMKEPLGFFQVSNLEWVQCKNKQKGNEILPHCIEITRTPPLFLSHSNGDELDKWKKALTKVGCKMSLTNKEKKLPIVFIYDMRERKDTWKQIKRKIYDSVGKKIDIVVDWDAYAANPNFNCTDGSVVRTLYEYLHYLSLKIEKSCKGGDIEREAFINGVYKSIIRVGIDASIPSYHLLTLEDGELRLKTNESFANSDTVGKNLEDLYQFAGGQEVPLAIRKNIRDSNVYLLELVDSMKTLSGGQNFTFEVDWKSLANCEAIKRDQWDNIAEVIFRKYFKTLVEQITNFCQEESIWKIFFEKVSQKKISLSLKKIEQYHTTQLVGGVFHLYVSDKYWSYNIDTVGKDFIKTVQKSGDNEIPLEVKKLIDDAEPKKQEILNKLHQITGSDFTINIDWITIFASIEETNHSEAPHIVYEEYLGSLIKKLEVICKDEMVKETFVRAVSLKQINFTMSPLDKVYHNLRISPEGAIFVECNINGGWKVNSSTCGEKIEEILDLSIDSDNLPLKVRKSIRDAEPFKINLQETFKLIGNRNYHFEVDWIGLVNSESIDKNQWDKLGELVYKSYLLTLGKNILALSKRSKLINETFNEYTYNSKVTFEISVLPSGQYHSVQITDGDVKVISAQGGWYTNVGNIGKSELLEELSTQDLKNAKIPLILRIISEEKSSELQESQDLWNKIIKGNGLIEIDWNSFVENLDRKNWSTASDVAYETIKILINSIDIVSKKKELVPKGNIIFVCFKKIDTKFTLIFCEDKKQLILTLDSNIVQNIESFEDNIIENLLTNSNQEISSSIIHTEQEISINNTSSEKEVVLEINEISNAVIEEYTQVKVAETEQIESSEVVEESKTEESEQLEETHVEESKVEETEQIESPEVVEESKVEESEQLEETKPEEQEQIESPEVVEESKTEESETEQIESSEVVEESKTEETEQLEETKPEEQEQIESSEVVEESKVEETEQIESPEIAEESKVEEQEQIEETHVEESEQLEETKPEEQEQIESPEEVVEESKVEEHEQIESSEQLEETHVEESKVEESEQLESSEVEETKTEEQEQIESPEIAEESKTEETEQLEETKPEEQEQIESSEVVEESKVEETEQIESPEIAEESKVEEQEQIESSEVEETKTEETEQLEETHVEESKVEETEQIESPEVVEETKTEESEQLEEKHVEETKTEEQEQIVVEDTANEEISVSEEKYETVENESETSEQANE